VRRREFLAASVAVSAGCLKDQDGPTGSDPVEAFGTELSRGSSEPVEASATTDRSFESDGDGVVVRQDGDERRLDEKDWKRDLCHGRALLELRDTLERRIGVGNYAYVVPTFGEVGVEPTGDGLDGETLDSLGIQDPKTLTVQYVVLLDDNGEVVRSPAISYREVIDATPESVSVLSPFEDGAERTVDCPVVVWKTAGLR